MDLDIAPPILDRRVSTRQASVVDVLGSIEQARKGAGNHPPIGIKPDPVRSAPPKKSVDSVGDVSSSTRGVVVSSDLLDRWRSEGPSSKFKSNEQLHRLQMLSRYVPRAVSLPILVSGMHVSGSASSSDAVRSPFFGIVLLSDISGFTQLAADLAKGLRNQAGPDDAASGVHLKPSDMSSSAVQVDSMQKTGGERLASILNTVFSRFIDIVRKYGGDVTKFAGDALLSVFRPESASNADMLACGLNATRAALEMQEGMQSLRDIGINLGLHSGLSAGKLHELHFGGFESRWEYMFAGQPIFEMGRALEAAVRGEVVMQASVYELIKGHCQVQQRDDDLFLLEAITADVPTVFDSVPDLIQYLSHSRSCRTIETALACYLPRSVILALNAGKQGLIGERRQVTMVFINLPDFHYDTDPQIQSNQRSFRAIQQELHRFDGTLRQLIQDDKGTVAIAAFGLPYNSHDDDPVRAIQASLTIQTLLTEMGMRTGIGVTTGGAFCGSVGDETRCEYAIVGDIVNLSARLMVASHNGLLCDGDTHKAVYSRGRSEWIDFEKMDPIKVKGRQGIVQVFRPTPSIRQQTLDRPFTLMLGRKAEIDLARTMFAEIWRRHQQCGNVPALAADKPHASSAAAKSIMLIEGDSGMGKTRLVQDIWEMAQEYQYQTFHFAANRMLDSVNMIMWTSVLQCMVVALCPQGTDSKLPFAALLASSPHVQRLDAHDIDALVGIAGSTKRQHPANAHGPPPRPYHRKLQSKLMTTSATRSRSRAILHLMKIIIDVRGPICMVVENLRDLDAMSSAHLDYICKRLPRNTIVFLTARPIPPTYETSALEVDLTDLPYFVKVKLAPLSRREIEALLCLRLHMPQLPESLLDTVHKSSEGNPYLVVALATGLDEANIPGERFTETAHAIVQHMLEQIITSHIDGLSPSQQEVLKCASVIGVVFTLELLQAICSYGNERLMENLVSLEANDFIITIANLPKTTYAFRQPLMQATVYELLSKNDSSIYHNLIVDELERYQQDRLLTGRLESIPATSSELAHHYQCAGRLHHAIQYYRLAGEAAFSLGDFLHASLYSGKGLALLEEFAPEDRFEIAKLQRSIAKSLMENYEMVRCRSFVERALLNLDSEIPSATQARFFRRWSLIASLQCGVPTQCRTIRPLSDTMEKLILERAKCFNMLSIFAIDLGNGSLALNAAAKAMEWAEICGSVEQRIYSMSHIMMGGLTNGNLQIANKFYKRTQHELELAENGSGSLHIRGYIYVRLAQVAFACFGDSIKAQQFLQSASDLFTTVNSPHHIIRTLDQLASVWICLGMIGESGEIIQSLEKVSNWCSYSWGQRRAVILLVMSRMLVGDTISSVPAFDDNDIGDDLRSQVQWKSCRMVSDWYQGRVDEAISQAAYITTISTGVAYDALNAISYAAQVAILHYRDLIENASDIEIQQGYDLCTTCVMTLTTFARRIPLARSRLLIVQGLFNISRDPNSAPRATELWQEALGPAGAMGLLYEQAMAHRLIGTFGERKRTTGRRRFCEPPANGEIDRDMRAWHLAQYTSITKDNGFVVILLPPLKDRFVYELESDDDILDRTATDRDLRLFGYRRSNQVPMADMIEDNPLALNGATVLQSDVSILCGLNTAEELIGRDEHLATLFDTFRLVPRPTEPIVLFGQTGIGKSALARRFVSLASREDQSMKVFTMYGESSYRPQTYLPVVRVLRKMICEFGRCLNVSTVSAIMLILFERIAEYRVFRNAITHLIYSSHGMQDPSIRLLSEVSRSQVLAAIFVQLIRTIARQFPICLIFEDLQWLDSGTWHVLSMMAADPIVDAFILCTVETSSQTGAEIVTQYPQSTFFLNDRTRWLRLQPLDRAALSILACKVLKVTRLTSRLEILLTDKSRGNPLSALQIMSCLQEDHLLMVAGGGADLAADVVDVLFAISGSSSDLSLKRLALLTKSQTKLLRLASVIGVSFPYHVLRMLSSQYMDTTTFKAELVVLKNRGWLLLANMRSNSPRISFPHSSTREDIYRSLNENLRRKLHLAVAEYYETGSNGSAYMVPLVAKHYRQSHVFSLDRKYNLLAGDQFYYIFMKDDAVDAYQHVMEGQEVSPTTRLARSQLLCQIGNLHLMSEDNVEAKRNLLAALVELGAPYPSGNNALGFITELYQIQMRFWVSLRRRHMMLPESGLEGAILDALSRTYRNVGEKKQAQWCAVRSLLASPTSSADDLVLRYVWFIQSCNEIGSENAPSMDFADIHARRLIPSVADLRTLAMALEILAKSAAICGYWRLAIVMWQEALVLFKEFLFDCSTAIAIEQHLGAVYSLTGDLAQSNAVFDRALRSTKLVQHLNTPTINRSWILLALNQVSSLPEQPDATTASTLERDLSQALNTPSMTIPNNHVLLKALEAAIAYRKGEYARAFHSAVELRKNLSWLTVRLVGAGEIPAQVLVSLLLRCRDNDGFEIEDIGIPKKTLMTEAEEAIKLLHKTSSHIAFIKPLFLLWHGAFLWCRSYPWIDIVHMLRLAQRSAIFYTIPSAEAKANMFLAEIFAEKSRTKPKSLQCARRALQIFNEIGDRVHLDRVRVRFPEAIQSRNEDETVEERQRLLIDQHETNEKTAHHATRLASIYKAIQERLPELRDRVTKVFDGAMEPGGESPEISLIMQAPLADEEMIAVPQPSSHHLDHPQRESRHSLTTRPSPNPYHDPEADGDPDAKEDESDQCPGSDSDDGYEMDQARPIPIVEDDKEVDGQQQQLQSSVISTLYVHGIGLIGSLAAPVANKRGHDVNGGSFAELIPRPVVLGSICRPDTTNDGSMCHMDSSNILACTESFITWAVIQSITIVDRSAPISKQGAISAYKSLFDILVGQVKLYEGAILELSSNRLLLIWDMSPTLNQSRICSQSVSCAFSMIQAIAAQQLDTLFDCFWSLSCGDILLITTSGAESYRGYMGFGPALIEAFQIEEGFDDGRVVIHKNMLKLLRVCGRVDVRREVDDKKYAIIQGFNANTIESHVNGTLQLISFIHQYNVDERGPFTASEFAKHRHPALPVASALTHPDLYLSEDCLDITIVCIRCDVPHVPAQADNVIATFAFEIHTVRLSEPSCVFASLSSTGTKITAVVAFEAIASRIAFLFAFRIRFSIGQRFGTECSIGIATGLCRFHRIEPLGDTIIVGDAMKNGRHALSLAADNILIDEDTQDAFEEMIVSHDHDQQSNMKALRVHFVLESLKLGVSFQWTTSVVLCGRAQQRILLEDAIISSIKGHKYRGHVMVINGPKGIGKTTLLTNLLIVASNLIDSTQRKASILSCFGKRLYGGEKGDGSAMRVLMKQLLAPVAASLGGISQLRAKYVATINKLAPKLAQELWLVNGLCGLGFDRNPGTNVANLIGETVPSLHRKSAQIMTMLIGMIIPQSHQILIIIDDIDHLDKLSVICLEEILVHIPSTVLIMSESDSSHDKMEIFASRSQHESVAIPLLSPDDSVLLASLSLAGAKPTPEYVAFVGKLGSGQPGKLSSVAHCASRLCRLSRRVLESNTRDSNDRIDRIMANELTSAQSSVLAICSVCGVKFEYSVLLAVLSLIKQDPNNDNGNIPSTAEQIESYIDVFVKHTQLLCEVPSSDCSWEGRWFMFTSDIAHTRMYSGFEIEKKRKIHGLVADVLEERKVHDNELLAHHWRMARNYDKSIAYQVKVARQFLKSRNIRKAITYYKGAVASWTVLSRRRPSVPPSVDNTFQFEKIHMELAEAFIICEEYQSAIESLTAVLTQSQYPIPIKQKLPRSVAKARHWIRKVFKTWDEKGRSDNRIVPDHGRQLPNNLSHSVGVDSSSSAHLAARAYIAFAHSCIMIMSANQGFDAAIKAVNWAYKTGDPLLIANASATISDLYLWHGWTDMASSAIEGVKQCDVITLQTAIMDITRGNFAMAEPKLKSCNVNKLMIDNPMLWRRVLLTQVLLAILQEDLHVAIYTIEMLEKGSAQYGGEPLARRCSSLSALIALLRNNLDNCITLLLGDNRQETELSIMGQAILCLVYLRMGQISKASAWFGTLFLDYASETFVARWDDVYQHVLMAEYLVQILIDDPTAQDRPNMPSSPISSPKSKQRPNNVITKTETKEIDTAEARRHLALVVKRLREFASRYSYAKGLADLYGGCLELIDGRSIGSGTTSIGLFVKALTALEVSDLRFFEARARLLIGSNNGFRDHRDHDMLIGARQYFSTARNQHYLNLVDDALQRLPLTDLFAKSNARRERIMSDVVSEAVAGAFIKRGSVLSTRQNRESFIEEPTARTVRNLRIDSSEMDS